MPALVNEQVCSEFAPELGAALDRVAAKVKSLHLELPVALFLELHLPFITIFHTAGLLLEPIASPLFGAERIHTLKLLLSDRKNIEALIQRLETSSIAKKEENTKR